jgi:ABC-type multidrug transport system fused ATPase/permease subunit
MVSLVYPLQLRAYQLQIWNMIKLMSMFGPAHTLFSYLISFGFTNPQSALKFISLVYMVAGFILPFIFKVISLGIDRCEGNIYAVTSFLSQGIPLQPMSNGLMDLVNKGHRGFFEEQKYRKNEAFSRNMDDKKRSHGIGSSQIKIMLDWEKCDGFVKDVDTALVALALSCVVSIVLIFVVERFKLLFYQSAESKYQESNDIDLNDKSKYLQTRNLTKTYSGNVKAVQGISFNLNSNREVLGLLGANGAGKSSTFNMVTMQIKRTSGDIALFNQNISTIDRLQDISITAQQDILWPYLSI